MVFRATTEAGTYDISQLVQQVKWSGSQSRIARQLQLDYVQSLWAENFPQVDIPVGSVLEMLEEDGSCLFYGYVVTRKRIGDAASISLTALDRGMYLANNQGTYKFSGTAPEAIAAQVCQDYGVPVKSLVQTGVKVSRKFAGVKLSEIIMTAYTLASESTEKRYTARFDGQALLVKEKAERADLILAPKANLMTSSVTESIEKLVNSVAIYDENGALLQTVEDAETVELYGLMQRALTQKDEDKTGEARRLLEDNGLQQTIKVTVLGDTRMITGESVVLRAGSAGVSGLFWVEEDTHNWSGGQYTCTLSLNFRNLMQEADAGEEIDT